MDRRKFLATSAVIAASPALLLTARGGKKIEIGEVTSWTFDDFDTNGRMRITVEYDRERCPWNAAYSIVCKRNKHKFLCHDAESLVCVAAAMTVVDEYKSHIHYEFMSVPFLQKTEYRDRLQSMFPLAGFAPILAASTKGIAWSRYSPLPVMESAIFTWHPIFCI